MHKISTKMKSYQPFEAATPSTACTATKCTSDKDEDRLQCRKCKRYVHYECTQLPLYQLQIFVTTYNEQYTCQNCVRITRSLSNKVGKTTHHMMQRELEHKDSVIEKLTKELNKLNNPSNNHEIIKNELETLLAGKIADLEAKTRKIIKEEIKQTRNLVTESLQMPSKATYAEMTKMHRESLKSVVKEQKEEDKREERDIASRKHNIIIHGLIEPDTDSIEEDQEEDRSEIEEILDEINIRDIKLTHHRIGKKHDRRGKRRPIKIILQSMNEKDRILNNLYKLKKYRRESISITDDFTINERKRIKEMHEQAKKMNTEHDGDFIWRVRGNPRTSLCFVKRPRNIRNNTPSLSSVSDDWTDED